MTNVNIQTEHIIAYLEGKLSKEDSLAFEKQMLDSPELRKEVGDLRFICDTSQMLYLQEKIDVDNQLEKCIENQCRKTGSDKRSVAIFVTRQPYCSFQP